MENMKTAYEEMEAIELERAASLRDDYCYWDKARKNWYGACVHYMDNDILEAMHHTIPAGIDIANMEGADEGTWTFAVDFLCRYCELHQAKYGQAFVIN